MIEYNVNEYQYLKLLEFIKMYGNDRSDRTGTGTRGIFGAQMVFDLEEGFPLLTTKKMFFRGIVEELLWIIRGETNVKSLQERGVKIWDEWATQEQCAKFGREPGNLGPVYGHQWRNFGASGYRIKMPGDVPTSLWTPNMYEEDGVDQLRWVVDEIKKNPNSRRLIVTAWNPREANQVALPPCHTLFQFYVQDGKLDCQLYQRSGDMFLGVPFNIASYALLTHLVAKQTGLKPGRFVHTLGDAHIYRNHFEQVSQQLLRSTYQAPGLLIADHVDIFGKVAYEDISLVNYECHPPIAGAVSV